MNKNDTKALITIKRHRKNNITSDDLVNFHISKHRVMVGIALSYVPIACLTLLALLFFGCVILLLFEPENSVATLIVVNIFGGIVGWCIGKFLG